jgi:hypothetical protein
MAESTGGQGGGGDGGAGTSGGGGKSGGEQGAGWPSKKFEKESGTGRDNNPPKQGK